MMSTRLSKMPRHWKNQETAWVLVSLGTTQNSFQLQSCEPHLVSLRCEVLRVHLCREVVAPWLSFDREPKPNSMTVSKVHKSWSVSSAQTLTLKEPTLVEMQWFMMVHVFFSAGFSHEFQPVADISIFRSSTLTHAMAPSLNPNPAQPSFAQP
jgi:hypothetical protein